MTQCDAKFRVQNGTDTMIPFCKYLYIDSYVSTMDRCAPRVYSLYLACNI